MKKLIVFLFFITSLTVQGQQFNKLINLDKYANANKELLANGVQPKVIFMGNSITEGWVSQRPDFFTSNHFVGRGISGQTTPQMLSRFREDVINLHPKAVVINAGINDITNNTGPYNEQFTLGNIMSMAELAHASGIKVILTSVLPAGGPEWRKDVGNVPAIVDSINAKIKAYAKSKGFAYIDYNTKMRDENGVIIASYSNDNLHPNAEGYVVMESVAIAVIQKVVKK